MAKQNKKILIVEDDEDFLSILKIKFETDGFSVKTANDGIMGLAEAEKEKPDIILSDMLLPKMDGMEMAKKIREANIDTPIIFLTNLKEENGAQRSQEFDYLIKADLRIDQIVEKVKEKLNEG